MTWLFSGTYEELNKLAKKKRQLKYLWAEDIKMTNDHYLYLIKITRH